MKLSSLRIVSKNVPALAEFYAKILKVDAAGDEDFVEFEIDGTTLAFCSQRSMAMFHAGATTPAGNQSAILEFQVDDLDGERKRLASVVKDWVQEPTDQAWGNRSMLFRDPEGNLINFYAPIH